MTTTIRRTDIARRFGALLAAGQCPHRQSLYRPEESSRHALLDGHGGRAETDRQARRVPAVWHQIWRSAIRIVCRAIGP